MTSFLLNENNIVHYANTPSILHGYKNDNFHDIFLLFFLSNKDCCYKLEPPQRVPTIYVLRKNKKNITIFHLKIIILTAVKYSTISHGHVCVMLYIRMSEKSSKRIISLIKCVGELFRTLCTSRRRTVHASLWKHIMILVSGKSRLKTRGQLD